jgi:hypothetical protein
LILYFERLVGQVIHLLIEIGLFEWHQIIFNREIL